MSGLFLGVDGGQSSTTAVIGDAAGRVLGFGRGGPCSYVRAPGGRERFTSAMRDCLAEACRTAGIENGELAFESAVLGFSGGPAGRESILAGLFRAERLAVVSDVEVALSGALAEEPGIITIAGTGSASFGRNAKGETARAGGWGPMFGDEGAAFDLTRRALRAALRAKEGWGAPTILHDWLLQATGIQHVHDLVREFYTADYPASRIASYAELVGRAASQGDEAAIEILRSAAVDLARLASVVRRRLFPSVGAVRVAYVGGTFRILPLLQQFRAMVEMDGTMLLIPPIHGPAIGALLDAYRAAGFTPALSNVPEFEK